MIIYRVQSDVLAKTVFVSSMIKVDRMVNDYCSDELRTPVRRNPTDYGEGKTFLIDCVDHEGLAIEYVGPEVKTKYHTFCITEITVI